MSKELGRHVQSVVKDVLDLIFISGGKDCVRLVVS